MMAAPIALGQVELDGIANELAWMEAEWSEDFVQRSPREGNEPSEETRVAVLHDDQALYVFVDARDRSPEQIRARLTRRDEDSPSDWVEIWLAPQRDRRVGYRFAVNPLGVRVDSRISDGGEAQDRDWNGLWTVATHRNELGWSAEFRIPFSALRFEQPTHPWGLNVTRLVARLPEESVLSPTPRSSARPLRHLAELRGLNDLSRPRKLEVRPYISTALQRVGGPFELTPRIGGDANIGLGSERTLHLSALPDFGQVQSDPSQLNLTAFEIFLPEKRPFFLEGREVFRFPLAQRNRLNESLFYSRRIGAKPSRDLGVSEDEVIDYPTQTSIVGAAKVNGRESNGLNYGFLTAATEGALAEVRQAGVDRKLPVAAPTGYAVARLRKEFDHGHSAVGTMVTFAGRRLTPELGPILVEHAFGAATDFELRQGDFGLLGHVLGTQLTGSSDAITSIQRSSTHYFQRPDAPHLKYDPTRTSLVGWGAELVGGKFDGTPWRATWTVRARSPGLNPNDVGYLQRADQQHAELWLQRREDQPGPFHRYYHVAGAVWLDKTFGPEVTGLGATLNGYWQLPDHSATYLGVRRNLAALDVSLLRGGPAFLVPGKWDAWWGIGTDERRSCDVDLELSAATRDNDSLVQGNVAVSLNIHPISSIRISVAPSFDRSSDALQFVRAVDPNTIILGRLLRNTVSVTLRASWAISTALTLEAYAMPYMTAGTYAGFYQVVSPRASAYEERLRLVDYQGEDRFTLGQLRSNLLLRWEYLPGSTLFLAWTREQTQQGNDVGVVRMDRELSSIFASRSYDSVLFKLSHLFPL